jgi:hypothetical protein
MHQCDHTDFGKKFFSQKKFAPRGSVVQILILGAQFSREKQNSNPNDQSLCLI